MNSARIKNMETYLPASLINDIMGTSFAKVEAWITRPSMRQLQFELEAYKMRQEGLLEEVAQLKKDNGRLKKLSCVDELTGLANRRAFVEFVSREWQLATREKKPLSAIMIDIDYFKQYNDSYGHQAGDVCLEKVARALSSITKRPEDIVARIGGEEFVVILGNTSGEVAKKIAEKIRIEVENLEIEHGQSKASKHVTISSGVASLFPSSSHEPDTLIESADKALYKAKSCGRNRVGGL